MPLPVQQAIIKNREYFTQKNQAMQASSFMMGFWGIPIFGIGGGFRTRPPELEPQELEFWSIEEDGVLWDFLNDDVLSGLQLNPDIPWDSLPSGYGPLVRVLGFERHCQGDGWTAVSNEGADEMQHIIAAYQVLGLPDEASALQAVTQAYLELGDDEHPKFHEILGRAYRSVKGGDDDEDARWAAILHFVRKHPEQFGVVVAV